ncbi:MAG: RdgB/HAM1 family non-canonical purine NTP pyrophosphatase [Schleiferiaceae bacterium]|jgi:XTP/dITP diphosphohydrolase|nr:RdgB/HAM1 family non-canonical purine NTP pyrophosphatase [Schleiferiaceae bacterium]MDP4758725.1 RdgB/HAM1 family non-canonical purine NTP pyrophosphatase [Schleiferiaceae bacterium]MDP4767823.1 RdgB/HAM1 family non-canonical purine NTP pyrophosphatase [Schleiferiaceae bacterium]
MKLVFATHNPGKLQEVRELLAPDYEVIGLSELGDHEDIEETALTLEGNAWIKARTVWQKHGLSCFSDDTGLEIEALDGAPGVFSARFAGPDKDPQANMDKVLDELKGQGNRKARFRTAVALVLNGEEFLFEGTVNGEITTVQSGAKGFGYDPIFSPNGYDTTFAEMDGPTKNAISHRGLAIKKLVAFLKAH